MVQVRADSNQLLVGPGASGKSTLLYKMGLAESAVRDSSLKWRADKGFKKGRTFLYLNPNYKQVQVNESVRGLRHNTDAWLDVAAKNHAEIIVCYVPEGVHHGRLVVRLHFEMVSKYLDTLARSELWNILLDRSIDDGHINQAIKHFLRAEGKVACWRKIKSYLAASMWANLCFSYKDLFANLEQRAILYTKVEAY